MKLDDKQVRSHFESKTITMQNVIAYSRSVYEEASRAKNTLLSSDMLIFIIKKVCEILGTSDEFKRTIQYNLYDTLAEYRILGNLQTRTASLKSPVKIRELISSLWLKSSQEKKFSKPFSLTKLIRRKMAAVHTLICFLTGRRWVDISRLRWDDVQLFKLKHATCLRIPINISKANSKGNRNESICLIKDDSKLCPIKILHHFWILSGRPKVGFILKCQDPNRQPRKHFFTSGRAYCCKGHYRSGKLTRCLGNINGNVTQGVMAREAKALGFKKPPTKHTFRKLLVVMAYKMGFSRERICEMFGWKHDSEMPARYLGENFGTAKDSLSIRLANEIKKDNLSTFLEDVPIKD